MRNSIITILLFASILSVNASADCVKGRDGKVVCGKGQCEKDSYGKIFCAGAGGGAVKDMHGNVLCGIGYCEKDYLNKVWCSKEQDGGAAVDSLGEVKCLQGCAPGSPQLCSEAR